MRGLASRRADRAAAAVRRPVRRVALYGFLGAGNIGNDASMEAVLAWLHDRHPEIAVSGITISPETLRERYRLPATWLAWYQAHPGRPRPADVLGKLFGRLLDVPRSLLLVGRVDAVVVPGMGVLEESLGVTPWGLPLWMFLISAACRVRRRPFVLLAVGAEPVRHRITRLLFAATVRLASHVSYRDIWSREAMRANGVDACHPVVPDLAFAHPSPADADPRPGTVVVGVIAYSGEGAGAGPDVLDQYVRTMADVVERLAADGDRVVLVGGDRVDEPVAARVAEAVLAARPELGDAVTVPEVDGFAALSSELARAEVVVASRFHNLIAAVRLGRPVVSVGYAAKSARLMDGLGLAEYCQDVADVDGARLLEQIRRARAAGDDITQQIRAKTSGYELQVTSLLEQLERVGARRARYHPARSRIF
ncbi:MAG TPA: polysaccharide pyruvyl transferase family protein [Kineosporiaceae bacterium]